MDLVLRGRSARKRAEGASPGEPRIPSNIALFLSFFWVRPSEHDGLAPARSPDLREEPQYPLDAGWLGIIQARINRVRPLLLRQRQGRLPLGGPPAPRKTLFECRTHEESQKRFGRPR
jgi:hypothetical protein